MLFTSPFFLVFFLPIALAVACSLRGQKLLRWITLASLAFYALEGQPWFLIPMLITTALDYFVAIRLEQTKSPGRRKAWFLLSLCGNLGLLFYFKYSALILSTLTGPFGINAPWVSWFNVILPAGISFYTFQTLAYIIDVYRKETPAERNFWKFASFVTFFPHLVAGPLTRHNQLLPPLENIAQSGVHPRWKEGVFLFAVGFCKKLLVADPFGSLVDQLLLTPDAMTPLAAWTAAVAYGLQIYFDFSGYSDMAIGIGRLFGMELPQNFNDPYQAKDPSDFWTRWHITLSRWLRDYLYISLGGNRLGRVRQGFNLFITMFLGGLWHGANWTFALWGLYHGLLLILFHASKRFWEAWPIALQRAVTFNLICFGWIFFRSDSLSMSMEWWKSLLGMGTLSTGSPSALRPAMICLLALVFLYKTPVASRYEKFDRLNALSQVVLGALFVLAILYAQGSSRFLYYQF